MGQDNRFFALFNHLLAKLANAGLSIHSLQDDGEFIAAKTGDGIVDL